MLELNFWATERIELQYRTVEVSKEKNIRGETQTSSEQFLSHRKSNAYRSTPPDLGQ